MQLNNQSVAANESVSDEEFEDLPAGWEERIVSNVNTNVDGV